MPGAASGEPLTRPTQRRIGSRAAPVLAVGFIGAILARLRPRGMTRVLFAMAGATALIAVVALIFELGRPASGPVEIVGVNGLFITLFVGSALLFREAARGTEPLRPRSER